MEICVSRWLMKLCIKCRKNATQRRCVVCMLGDSGKNFLIISRLGVNFFGCQEGKEKGMKKKYQEKWSRNARGEKGTCQLWA